MKDLRLDADTIDASSDAGEHICDDIRLAWLCAELGGGRTFRARRRMASRRCGPIADRLLRFFPSSIPLAAFRPQAECESFFLTMPCTTQASPVDRQRQKKVLNRIRTPCN